MNPFGSDSNWQVVSGTHLHRLLQFLGVRSHQAYQFNYCYVCRYLLPEQAIPKVTVGCVIQYD